MAYGKKADYEEFVNCGFTETGDSSISKPQSVVCLKVLTSESFKTNHIQKHLKNLHQHLSSKPRECFVNFEK